MGLMLLSASSAPATPTGKVEAEDVTYVIHIDGPIENALLYVLRRGIREAGENKARAIVFVMDTPGGRLDAADEIVRLLLALKVPTYTLVKNHAFSAGAIIALATDHIYMAPGSVIGDAMPILMTPFGGVQEMPKAIEEKMASGVSALIRSAAQQKGHDPLLAEAMVRRDAEYKIGDKIINPNSRLLTLTNIEAAQTVEKDGVRRPLLSRGTVGSVDELLKLVGRSHTRQLTFRVTTAERVARHIEAISMILLAIGLLGIYIEFKTPGFGLPGIVGIACLIVFFWGHHIAGLAGMEDVLLFFIGVILVILEVFFFPGFGLIGVLGIAIMALAAFSAMTPPMPEFSAQGLSHWSLKMPLLKFASALTMAGVALYLLAPRLSTSKLLSPLVLRTENSRTQGYTAGDADGRMVGARGKALSDLRPSGLGEFGAHRLDVVTRGEFLEVGAPLCIVEIHGQRIVVKKAG